MTVCVADEERAAGPPAEYREAGAGRHGGHDHHAHLTRHALCWIPEEPQGASSHYSCVNVCAECL